MYHTLNFPLITYAQTKYRSCSICFVFECKTELEVIEIELTLSHQIIGVLSVLTSSSLNNDLIHIILAIVLATLIKSAFVLDLDTLFYFLAHHDIGFFLDRYNT